MQRSRLPKFREVAGLLSSASPHIKPDDAVNLTVRIAILAILIVFLPFISTTALIAIPIELVEHAQGRISGVDCSSRSDEIKGFIGDPDFYGLGIRIGIYLQWMSSLIAGAKVRKQIKLMLAAYTAFNGALYVALLLLIFRKDCAFSAEVIVILYLLWGGVYIVFEQSLVEIFSIDQSRPLQALSALQMLYFTIVVTGLLVPTTAWFWIRMATVGETDFLSSPGGTSFFLFARVNQANLKLASCFMVALFFFTYYAKGLLPIVLFGRSRQWNTMARRMSKW